MKPAAPEPLSRVLEPLSCLRERGWGEGVSGCDDVMAWERQNQKPHPHPALRASLSRERERGSRHGAGACSPPPGLCARRAVLAQQPHQLEHVLRHRRAARSEEHTSELQSLMRISYAVFCLKKKKT